MALSHMHHASIVAILAGIDKGEKQQVVSAVDKIVSMLLESKLAYQQTIMPNLVGCHETNRNGYGLSPIEVHSLGAEIARLGWSWGACQHAICVEEDANKSIGKFTAKLSAMSEYLAPMSSGEIAYGSLSCSHTNAFLAATNAACPTMEKTLAVDDRLSATAIGNRDPGFQEALTTGLRWTVVRREVPQMYPTLCELIQHARNATSTVARRESEMQLLLRIQEMLEGEMGSGVVKRPVDWAALHAKVVQRVISSDVGDVNSLCKFVKRWGGGYGGQFMQGLRLFHQVHMSADRIIPSTTFEALADMKTTIAESVPFFVMATVKAQGACPQSKVANRICRFILKGDIAKVVVDKRADVLKANELLSKIHELGSAPGVC